MAKSRYSKSKKGKSRRGKRSRHTKRHIGRRSHHTRRRVRRGGGHGGGSCPGGGVGQPTGGSMLYKDGLWNIKNPASGCS